MIRYSYLACMNTASYSTSICTNILLWKYSQQHQKRFNQKCKFHHHRCWLFQSQRVQSFTMFLGACPQTLQFYHALHASVLPTLLKYVFVIKHHSPIYQYHLDHIYTKLQYRSDLDGTNIIQPDHLKTCGTSPVGNALGITVYLCDSPLLIGCTDITMLGYPCIIF